MIKKIYLFFFIIFLVFFFQFSAHAQNTTTDSIVKTENVSDNLKKVDNLSIMEDVSMIAATIRNITNAYYSSKTKIINIINYYQATIKSIEETWAKIENNGNRFKNYIKNILGLNYTKHSEYLTLK